MMATIEPRPGFDWQRIKWAGPQEPQPDHCSYCDVKLPDDDEDAEFIPLIMWREKGSAAVFRDDCQARWWGIEKLPPEEDDR